MKIFQKNLNKLRKVPNIEGRRESKIASLVDHKLQLIFNQNRQKR